ncbi:DNA-binding response OmpR family regulator [Labrenzia sp. EL_159]|nr:DNA-binding response OmpR family regulator [Labrenzia sp. EL_162]MBG6196712.1 DNA-binding response OmpR family regulator [Labrenzia sp. EL_159]
MMDLARENARLREQLEIKEAAIVELRGLIADQSVQLPPQWKLTRIQCRILRFLLKRSAATREEIHAYLYGHKEDGGPDLENIRVHVCLLRKKLKPLDVTVGWCQDGGYYLSTKTKDKIRSKSDMSCATD